MAAAIDTRPRSSWFRPKYLVFGCIALMMLYVLQHNERFLIDRSNPNWEHIRSFQWWLLPHGLAGACALLLAPLQFSDRLRQRYTKVHRVIGRIYITAAFVLAPLGAYIQYVEEPMGAPRSFTWPRWPTRCCWLRDRHRALFHPVIARSSSTGSG